MKVRELAVALALGMAVMFFLQRSVFKANPAARYREVMVADTVLIRGEPDTVVRWRERIVYRTVQAEQVAVAPAAAAPDVTEFCRSAEYFGSSPAIADSIRTEPAPSVLLLLRSFRYDRGALSLTGPQSDGDLWRGDYRVGDRFQGRVVGDSVLVQSDRFSHLRKWGDRALWIAGGVAAAYVIEEVRP